MASEPPAKKCRSSSDKDSRKIPLCVFAKPPLPGRAKTRLAAKLGNEGASKLATAFISDFITMAYSHDWAYPVLATTSDGSIDSKPGFPAEAFPEGVRPESIPRWLQQEGDLGAKMEGIARMGLKQAPFVMMCGADSPGRPTERLAKTLETLEGDADVVLGPTDDGGFDIIGLKSCPDGLLANLPWSAPNTFEETKKRFEERGMKLVVLEKWWDVDEIEDLDRLKKLLDGGGAERAPATALALKEALASYARSS